MFFLLQNRSGLLMKERLYSTSVEIATINGKMDKQRLSESFFDSLKIISSYVIQQLKSTRKFI